MQSEGARGLLVVGRLWLEALRVKLTLDVVGELGGEVLVPPRSWCPPSSLVY